jgi:hypothetical protein
MRSKKGSGIFEFSGKKSDEKVWRENGVGSFEL